MSSIHIKLGLMKKFVKALGKSNSNEFTFLCNRFPRISETKMKECIFACPQIWEVLKDQCFEKTLTAVERRAWKPFQWLRANILGNKTSPLIQEEFEKLPETYKKMGYCMSLKVRFLDSHLHFFPQTLVRSMMSKTTISP